MVIGESVHSLADYNIRFIEDIKGYIKIYQDACFTPFVTYIMPYRVQKILLMVSESQVIYSIYE